MAGEAQAILGKIAENESWRQNRQKSVSGEKESTDSVHLQNPTKKPPTGNRQRPSTQPS